MAGRPTFPTEPHYTKQANLPVDRPFRLSGGADSLVKIWRVADGLPLYSLSGHTGAIYALAFSRQGDLLASGSGDTTLKLWRVADGNLNYTFTGHTDFVFCVDFSPDGATLASVSYDGTARLW